LIDVEKAGKTPRDDHQIKNRPDSEEKKGRFQKRGGGTRNGRKGEVTGESRQSKLVCKKVWKNRRVTQKGISLWGGKTKKKGGNGRATKKEKGLGRRKGEKKNATATLKWLPFQGKEGSIGRKKRKEVGKRGDQD